MVNANPHQLKSGDVVWRVQHRVDGKVVTDTFATEQAASQFAQLVDRVGGKAAREVLTRRRSGTSSPTLNEWMTTYLSEGSGILTGITPATRHGYRRIADTAFLPMLGEYPIDTISRDDIGRWVQWQERQPSQRTAGALISAKTVKNYQAVLSNALRAAVERGMIPSNPARGVKVTAGQSRVGVFLSPAEFDQLLTHAPAQWRPLLVFLVNTGCRWGEATAITWGDIDLSKSTPTVSITKAWKKSPKGAPVLGPPKSKKGRRTIPLNRKAVDYLPKQGPAEALVFTAAEGGRIWYPHFNTRVWRPTLVRAKLGKRPNIHDLRHTYASWLLAAGVPLNVVQTLLGHEDITTTVGTYGHLVPGAMGEVAAVLDRVMSGVAGPVVELDARA